MQKRIYLYMKYWCLHIYSTPSNEPTQSKYPTDYIQAISNQRVAFWASLHFGLLLNILAYRTFIASVLSFVMQLEPDPEGLVDILEGALRKLAPGPGMWATAADLCNLASEFSFKSEFPDPRWTALAAKLRVIHKVAPDCKRFKDELMYCQLECGRKPFPAWNDRCRFSVLASAEEKLSAKGILRRQIIERMHGYGRNATNGSVQFSTPSARLPSWLRAG